MDFLEEWCENLTPEQARNLAQSSVLSAEGQEQILWIERMQGTCDAIFTNPFLHSDLQVQLASTWMHPKAWLLAQNEGLVTDAQSFLLNQNDAQVDSALAANKGLDLVIQDVYYRRTQRPYELFDNPSLYPSIQRRIQADAIYGSLTQDEVCVFRKNPGLLPEIAEFWFSTGEERTLRNLAQNRGLSEDFQRRLLKAEVSTAHELAMHSLHTSIQVLLATEGDVESAAELVMRKDVASQVLRVFLQDKRPERSLVRTAAANILHERGHLTLEEANALPTSLIQMIPGAFDLYLDGKDRETMSSLIPSWRGTFGDLKEAVSLTL